MIRAISLLVLLCLLAPFTLAVESTNTKKKKRKTTAASATRSKPKPKATVARASLPSATPRPTAKAHPRPLPHFDPTQGDNVDGDDLEVRRAAVEALGPFDGTVVVVDPQTGRILTMVNQKTALESGCAETTGIALSSRS